MVASVGDQYQQTDASFERDGESISPTQAGGTHELIGNYCKDNCQSMNKYQTAK